jgi:carboxypeptidase Q
MRTFAIALTALATPALAQTPLLTPAERETRDRIIAAAQSDARGYRIIEDLTTEIGPRLAGSPAEARARDWAVARLRAEGFGEVRVEPFAITYWGRLKERATVQGRFTQPLMVAAIGGSPSTPAGGLTAQVVRFAHMDELRAADPAAVRGKIVFIDEVMVPSGNGVTYGATVAKRRACAPVAAQMGAAACLVRSAGTSNRWPHVGQGARGAAASIPKAVIANADAAQLTRLMQRGPVTLKLEIETESRPDAPSGNVIAEIRGTERPDEIVLVACHLDSWDNSVGALDDAFGCGVTTTAARIATEVAGPPKRTIRVVWFGAEEVGILGGIAYAERHKADLPRHIIASQSDSGGAPAFALETGVGDPDSAAVKTMAEALRPLAIVRAGNAGTGGPDIGPMRALGVPVFDLEQDVSAYFSIHHTGDDTLEKVDLASVRRNTAAYALMIWRAAWTDADFRAKPAAAR